MSHRPTKGTEGGRADKSSSPARDNTQTRVVEEISIESWNQLVRGHFVDPHVSPNRQGYRIVDHTQGMPSGNIATRYGINTSEVARNDVSSSEEEVRGKGKGKAVAKPKAKPGANTINPSSTKGQASRKPWTAQEEDRLVDLRCAGVRFADIAEKQLPGRNLKACQIKAAKLRKDPRYKDKWSSAKGQDDGGGSEEGEDEEDDEE